MSLSKSIQLVIVLLFLVSCGKTFRLKEKDFRWIPYKGTETLAFRSSTGDSDTIFLLKTSSAIVPTDPLDAFPDKCEHYSIASSQSDPAPPSGNHRYLGNIFLELSASSDKSPYLDLRLTGKDAWFYGGSFMDLKDLDTIKPITFTTRLKTYNDVIILLPESDEYSDRSNFITKVYWSKSEGLIRYDKKEEVYWELSNKYAP